MKKTFKYILVVSISILMVLPSFRANAGNEDRSGQAGAMQLLINPWARSTGWGGANVACAHGLEAQYLNVAGTAFTRSTEIMFAQTRYLVGSDVVINSFGLTQKAGERGVIGIGIVNMSFGDIEITTTELPEGGIGTFSPSLMNINISYARAFSNSIYGGINFKIISESISDVRAQGLAIDAGIQYVTGRYEHIKFGIALKNVGPRMSFNGDGLSFRGFVPGMENSMTMEHRSAEFELPSLIKIGAAYDFQTGETHKLTGALNFTSNSFTNDQYHVGMQYGWKDYLRLRAGYVMEKGMWDDAERTTAMTGPSAGFSVIVPMNKEKGSSFSLDYSYRASDPWQGTHSIGARIDL